MFEHKIWQRTLLFALILPLSLELTAQKLYSLNECLKLAFEQNDKLRIINTDSEIANIQYKHSKGAFIPSLAISNQHNISIGRVLDPTTYDFVENRTVYDMNASIVGSATLFSGLELYHNVEKSRLNNVSSQLSFEETKLELGIDVMTLYFQILLDKATISICENKINLLCKQEEQISKRVEYKAAVPADLLNVKADITNANVELVDATSKLQSDIVSICSLLGIDNWRTFDVTTIEMDADNSTFTDLILSENFDVIVSKLPSVKQSHVKSDIAMTDIKIASASYWPSIRLDAGFGTTFSNARSKFTGEDYSFGEQFRDNVSSYLSMTVSIPILSNVSTSRSVREKKLGYSRAKYEQEENWNMWTKEITQAVLLAQAAYSKHKLMSDNVCQFEEALDIVEGKYSLGAATYYDYQTAINNLYQSKAKESQAEYEFLLREKILDLYAKM